MNRPQGRKPRRTGHRIYAARGLNQVHGSPGVPALARHRAACAEEDPEVWLEIWFDKATEHYTRCRCNFNTPWKWHRWPQPLKNYQIAKTPGLRIFAEENSEIITCGIEVGRFKNS
jgi:hypothetical protein